MDAPTARQLAERLMVEYGLIQQGWKFVWLRAKRKFGHCKYRAKEIGLSWPLTVTND